MIMCIMLAAVLLLASLSGANASWWPWSSSTPAVVPPMVNTTDCDGKPQYRFSRADAWQCFLSMGDGRVAGHAKDGTLDFAEVKFGIGTHLTAFERLVGPSADGVMERCDGNGDGVITTAEYADSQRPSCIGTASDLCHVRAVCFREFPPAPLAAAPPKAKKLN